MQIEQHLPMATEGELTSGSKKTTLEHGKQEAHDERAPKHRNHHRGKEPREDEPAE
jgi:hypothetical protein